MSADDATFELRSAALGLGDRLASYVVLMAELRDDSAAQGSTADTRLWSALAIYFAGIRDEIAAAFRAMESDVADAYVTVTPEGEAK